MSKFILTCVLFTVLGISVADPHRPGKYLEHNRKVVNCEKYKREANQHSCVLSPFNAEGPFFIPDDHERSDITDGQVGVPLDLTINVVNSNDCNPIENMYVHIWHANALGRYSGINNGGVPSGGPDNRPNRGGPDNRPNRGGPGNGPNQGGPGRQQPNGGFGAGARRTPASDERFCRGYQITDSNGQVNFKTILPGWYSGRCLHIHVEVYPKNSTERADITYVGQIFFKNEMLNELKLIDPYSANTQRVTYNENDVVYMNHGNETILNLVSQENSYSAAITFGIDPDVKVSNS